MPQGGIYDAPGTLRHVMNRVFLRLLLGLVAYSVFL